MSSFNYFIQRSWLNLPSLLIIVISISLASCVSEDENHSESSLIENDGFFERELLASSEITHEHLKLLEKAGFGGSSVQLYRSEDLISGGEKLEFLIDGDAFVDLSSLESYSEELGSSLSRQYRTNRTVRSGPYDRYYTLFLRGSDWNNYPNVVAGIRDAANNYNNIGFRTHKFKVVLKSDPGFLGNEIRDKPIYVNLSRSLGSSTIARAGFPIRRRGARNWRLYDRIDFSTNFAPTMSRSRAKEVMTHELGHCMGIRHTDYFNRSISCFTGGNEGNAGVGAVHVPGTPSTTNVDLNSVFLSCGASGHTGNFSTADKHMLRTIFAAN